MSKDKQGAADAQSLSIDITDSADQALSLTRLISMSSIDSDEDEAAVRQLGLEISQKVNRIRDAAADLTDQLKT